MEHTQILLAELAKYEVAFIANAIADAEVNQANRASASLAPAELLAALCDHPEARMKMAMIALLLRQPSFGQYVPDAFMLVKNKAYFCYATAAFYLQQLYQHELTRYFGAQPFLQNWFVALFQTAPNASAEQGLQTVAVQQGQWVNPFTNCWAAISMWRNECYVMRHLYKHARINAISLARLFYRAWGALHLSTRANPDYVRCLDGLFLAQFASKHLAEFRK